jgi:hypothetical protein
MKKMLTKVICLLSVVGYANIGLAQCFDPCCPPPPKPQCEPCKACEICPPCEPCTPCCTEVPKTGEPCNCAYNAPARIDPACGWDAWLSISFIYWQVKEKGLELGYEFYSDPTISYHEYNAINMDFNYKPGFKIGAGYSFCRDDWTIYLEYTRLTACQSTDKDVTDANNYILHSGWLDTSHSHSFTYLNAAWDLSYNMFDLELGRPYYLGKKLVFKPHFGLRAGWIDQSYNINGIAEFASIHSHNNQDSWLIGPRTGVDTDWLVGCDFRLFGNVAGSLVYQNFQNCNKVLVPATIEATSDSIYLGSEEMSYITPNVEMSLGLGYGKYFFNNEWYFDLTVGYDFQYLWNQNMMRHLKDGQNNLADLDAGNLKLHGLTITARVDF